MRVKNPNITESYNACPIHFIVLPNNKPHTHNVLLAQTDTTIGFLAKDSMLINRKKGASNTKPLLMEVANLAAIIHRTPVSIRPFIRHAKRISYILPNNASFRVIAEGLHHDFLQGFTWLYSSSANPTKGAFCMQFAQQQCDVIVLDKRGLFAAKSSTIVKIRHDRIKKIR